MTIQVQDPQNITSPSHSLDRGLRTDLFGAENQCMLTLDEPTHSALTILIYSSQHLKSEDNYPDEHTHLLSSLFHKVLDVRNLQLCGHSWLSIY